jgi:hypothetical protein
MAYISLNAFDRSEELTNCSLESQNPSLKPAFLWKSLGSRDEQLPKFLSRCYYGTRVLSTVRACEKAIIGQPSEEILVLLLIVVCKLPIEELRRI